MELSLRRRCAVELIGTFVLVMLGPGAAMVSARTNAFGHVGIALAFGLAVTAIVNSCGRLSGAHINPAVTIGLWSVRRFRASEVVPFVFAQCAGAVLASLLSGWMLGPVGRWGATVPTLALPQAFVVELTFSAVLGFVIVALSEDERHMPLLPLIVGATIFVGALVAGPLTGGSFNPARSLGPAVVSGIWTAHWLYWLAPITGVVVGMWTYAKLVATSAGLPIPKRARSRSLSRTT